MVIYVNKHTSISFTNPFFHGSGWALGVPVICVRLLPL